MIYLVALLFSLFGLIFALTKLTLVHAPLLFVLSFRMLLGGPILLLISKILLKSKFSLDRLKWSIPLGVIAFYLTNLFEYYGLKSISASKACFIYSLTPFITALITYFLYGEKLTLKKMFGLLIGLSAFIPTFMETDPGEIHLQHRLFFSTAEIALVLATTLAVIGWLIIKSFLKRPVKDSIFILNGEALCVGGVISLIHFLIKDFRSVDVLSMIDNWPLFISQTLLIILISNVICYNLYGTLLRYFSPTFMSFAGFMTPLFAAIWGKLLLNENIAPTFIPSVLAVGVGLYIFYQDDLTVSKEKKTVLNAVG